MTINENLLEFGGILLAVWDPDDPELGQRAYRISIDWQEQEDGVTWLDKFYDLLESPEPEKITCLVVGAWEDVCTSDYDPAAIVEALVAARDKLSNLTAIFFGDIICEESEVSWIRQTDVSPLLAAYPKLQEFGVRGGMNLGLSGLVHETLKKLIVETGALDAAVVREIAGANLPALEHLEIWLGSENYGANTTVEDLRPFMDATRFPNLKYLGLRNCEYVDEIAREIAEAPILDQIETLDLSLGTLTSIGAEHLINSAKIKKLKRLDLHHHFISDESIAKLQSLGIDVDTSDQQDGDEDDGTIYRYIAVSE